MAVAREFSPRVERHGDALVSIDVAGLDRLVGTPRVIGEELRREAAARGLSVHIAVARTRSAAVLLALARAGLTVVDEGKEREALAPLAIGVLGHSQLSHLDAHALERADVRVDVLSALKRWGIRTLGDFAALPAAGLAARFGRTAPDWQALARGDDRLPLVPARDGDAFDASLELEWPIEGAEPLSFVLTRLLEPLSAHLERRDRGAAVLHVTLGLVTREVHARRLQLPWPIREVRALRTLVLLDLESHPPPAAIDRVAIAVDPTPARIVQHTLFARAQPAPEELSTLLARLGALMGQDRIGVPVIVDSYRPGAFAMQPLAIEGDERQGEPAISHEPPATSHQPPATDPPPLVSALRRFRHPVPARVAADAGRPVRVTTDRRGCAGGAVVACTGPWRISGEWWEGPFDRDEWDVTLNDGAVYRIFQNRDTRGWFIDAIVD